jgi:uncharacterized protein (DUF2252 family)
VRDAFARLVEYNRKLVGDGRDPSWMVTKLDRLSASPFGFLRGTFHLFAADWPLFGDDPLIPGAPQPIVGDLHLENFGAFRTREGSVVFDVNDFDETAPGTPAIDLMRVATSFLLADERHGELRAVDRIEAFLEGYLAAARSLDLRPIDGDAKLDAVREVIDAAEAASRPDWLEARVTGTAEQRRFKPSDKYHPVDGATRAAVIEGLRQFAAACDDKPATAGWPTVLDVAVRIAGTGSLGRFRYAALVQGKSEKTGKERILELKEALPSSLAPDEPVDQAARVIAHQRLLQGTSPAFLGTTGIGGRRFTVRELAPMEAKIDSTRVKPNELDQLCSACGTALGRLHRRGSSSIVARLESRDRALARRVAAFALRYAEVVQEDHAELLRRRPELEAALGLKAAAHS